MVETPRGAPHPSRVSSAAPKLPFLGLDTLWLQVAGTVCNIACRHCLVSAGPKVFKHRMMSIAQCEAALRTAGEHGVREVWFTGGEPFWHPEILALIDLVLAVAPLGILTNGMLIDDELAAALGKRFREAAYNLEIRVSLDGPDAESNDRVRGKGVFAATTEGIRRLARHGVEPIVAVTRLDDFEYAQEPFVALLRELGVTRPRVKWIPPFRIGREANRGRAYASWEALGREDLGADGVSWTLQCGTGRTVTAEGVYPCPILVNEPGRKLADDLESALVDHPVDHPACYTCFVEGFSCST